MKELVIKGSWISLRPMRKSEKDLFYRWAVCSDGTPFWYGKLYGDETPSRSVFFKDWKSHYFNSSKPELGRCFVILVNGRRIGQVNYNKIENGVVELDIIIADSKDWGMGYGSDAIRTLSDYLFWKMGAEIVWIAAHRKNKHAIRSYTRAGLNATKKPPGFIKITPKGSVRKRDWVVFMKEKIRRATVKDVPAIKKLWDELMGYHKRFGYGSGLVEYKKNKDSLYLKFIRKQLKRRNVAVFVAEIDDRIVGHVMVEISKAPPIYVHDKYAHIGEIVVDSKYRRKGIGKALLKEAELWAKKKKMTSIALTVHTKNKSAYSAYKKSGFKDFNLKMVKIVK